MGFRVAMCRRAQDLGVSGWVRNLADGRVEAMVRGSRENIEALVLWAQRGPPFARVQAVRMRHVDAAQFGSHQGFEARRDG